MTTHLMRPVVHACLRPLLVTMLLPLLLAGVTSQPVRAMTFAVTVTMNDANAPGGNSDVIHACATSGVPSTAGCSLRDAILFADSQLVTDTTTITLPAGTYTLTIPGVAENFAMTGDLDLTRNVIINGAGAGTTIIQASATGGAAGAIDRVFQVGTDSSGPITATISGVTVQLGGNTSGGNGTGILVYTGGSSLTLNDSIVANLLPCGQRWSHSDHRAARWLPGDQRGRRRHLYEYRWYRIGRRQGSARHHPPTADWRSLRHRCV